MKKLWAVLFLGFFGVTPVLAGEELALGQTLYLPVYSYIWHGDRVGGDKSPSKTLVSALVSIRNTSLRTPIRVVSARYYNTDGKLLDEYVPKPVVVGALGTLELFVERKEAEGGSGANFIIQWDAATATNPPVVEAVHADIRGGSHALSLITAARAIRLDK
ncbi:MAG: DUF3124 domain-containing protein [Gallionellaceae bacterium]|nr:MAG: DUF3124 domain-containing protein [Gallionellaceae bacterium]